MADAAATATADRDAAPARPHDSGAPGTSAAPPDDAAATAAGGGAAPTTCAAGAPIALATADRTPGALAVAVRGDRTAALWHDGGKTYAIVTDAAGAAVAPVVRLTLPDSHVKASHLLTGAAGFVIVTVDGFRCDVHARTLDAAGQLGAPVHLGRDVCSPAAYPLVAIRGDTVVIAATHAYEAQGVEVVRWPVGGTATRTQLVPRARAAAPLALTAAATGDTVLWTEGEDPMALGRVKQATIDVAGATSAAATVATSDEPLLMALVGSTPLELRARGPRLQARAGGRWVELAPATGGAASIVTFAGRTWLRQVGEGRRPARLTPLTDDGLPAGPGFDVPARALAHDGVRGAALGWAGRTLELRPLACPPT